MDKTSLIPSFLVFVSSRTRLKPSVLSGNIVSFSLFLTGKRPLGKHRRR
jgi:hypothetical protein